VSAATAFEAPAWKCGRFHVDLTVPRIMGIVNVTPDSFSDGGHHFDFGAARDHALRLIEEGADILDIGGESTRPGSDEVGVDEELRRVLPLVSALRDTGVPISVDTNKPQVMRAALDAGAAIINDVAALQADKAVASVAGSDCGVVLMHMQGRPRSMQAAPYYDDVVAEVRFFLAERRDALLRAGVAAERIALDPGFGFGKTPAHNLALLAGLPTLAKLAQPIVIGWSRKATLGVLTGRPVAERVYASVAAALLAVERGANVVRVHDVAATRDALRIAVALHQAEGTKERQK
jgi:dihydropteroate synthase